MSTEFCSVVVPVYNGAAYLSETIESCLSQDCSEKELVLVDDGSDDDSLQILEAFQAKHPDLIRVIKHTENRGLVQAFISGVTASRGVYIAVLGQDDVMSEDRLSVEIDAIRHFSVSMVCSNAYYLFGDKPSQQLVRPEWTSDRTIEKHDFLFRNPVIGPSALFRRKDLARISPSVFRFRNSYEWIFWFQLACLDGVYYLASPLLHYRRHQRSLSHTIFTTDEHRSYKHFCRRHILSRLTARDIGRALVSDLSFRLKNRLPV